MEAIQVEPAPVCSPVACSGEQEDDCEYAIDTSVDERISRDAVNHQVHLAMRHPAASLFSVLPFTMDGGAGRAKCSKV